MTVRVQTEDFNVGDEIERLRLQSLKVGAVVSFVGQVRDLNPAAQETLTLEHYPGMTEKSLAKIEAQAKARWPLIDTLIVHRVGELAPQAHIVLVAVSAAHRHDAFSACAFIMDFLKTDAPFWKKEKTAQGVYWLEAKAQDEVAKYKWHQ